MNVIRVIRSWGRAFRRVVCCGSGADAPEASNEPIYESLEHLRQTRDMEPTLQSLVDAVDEIRQLLGPIAAVQESMRRLERNLHPLLVYRPEDGEYMDMQNGIRPEPAAPPCSVWLTWLQERADYGEPW